MADDSNNVIDTLGDAMGLSPIEPEVMPVPIQANDVAPIQADSAMIVDNDFETARKNLLELAETGQLAVKDLAEFARTAPSGRVYEVLTQLLGTAADNNLKILDLHKKAKDLKGSDGPKHVTNQVILTTDELLKMIGNKDHRA